VRRLLQDKQLSAGHARALLPLGAERAITDLARDIVAQGLSVREVERRVNAARTKPAASGRKSSAAPTGSGGNASTAESRHIEELLRKRLQTGVQLHLTGKDKGEVRISFFSNDDLERLLELLGVRFDS
jgi:ParB family chromosome partitioning protein